MENVIIMYTSASHNVPSPTDSVILRKLGRFDHCFNAFWTCPVDKSLSQESNLNLLAETCRMTWNAHVHPPWQGWPGNLSWPTCELSPGPPGHMGSEEREPSIYRSQLHGPGTISLLPSDVLQNTKGQSLGPPYCMAGPFLPPLSSSGRFSWRKSFGSLSFLCHQFEFMGKGKVPKVLAGEFLAPFKCIWLHTSEFKCVYLLWGRIIS